MLLLIYKIHRSLNLFQLPFFPSEWFVRDQQKTLFFTLYVHLCLFGCLLFDLESSFTFAPLFLSSLSLLYFGCSNNIVILVVAVVVVVAVAWCVTNPSGGRRVSLYPRLRLCIFTNGNPLFCIIFRSIYQYYYYYCYDVKAGAGTRLLLFLCSGKQYLVLQQHWLLDIVAPFVRYCILFVSLALAPSISIQRTPL